MKNTYIALFAFFMTCIFAQDDYTITQLSEEEYSTLIDSVFFNRGERSPDDRRWILFPSCEDGPGQFPLIRTDQDATPIYSLCVDADVEDIAWAPKSDRFAFIDYDIFYDGGDNHIYVVNVFTEDYICINLHHCIEGLELGNRSKLAVVDLGWLPSGEGLVLSMDANFLGTSGDDMIDQHRIEDLGDDFGRNDPISAGYYIVEFVDW